MAVRRIKRVRVVLPPHAVTESSRRVAFGRRTTVSGWLGSENGTALGGRTVRVMAAPADGQNLFTQVAAATTRPDGSWSATLPPGPSRLVQAEYAGGPDTESTTSTIAQILVPAAIHISVRPSTVPWGGHTTISGRLLGGYIPPHSNVLKLLFGHGPRPHTIGTPDVRPDGRFTIPIAWSTGRGVVTYWFAVATLSEADYPYASGISRHVVVTVGR